MKKRLEEERERLIRELSGLGRKDPHNPANWDPIAEDIGEPPDPDKNVAADRIEELVSASGVVSELEISLANVTESLKRIALGTYGTCEVGGEPIEAERLEANPSARTCIKHIDSLSS